MRGKLRVRLLVEYTFRNIPAYAGKTMQAAQQGRLMEEHPRVCGENSVFKRFICFLIGTSPRMRGKRPLRSQ